jgi:hypothetical protein
VRWPAFRSSRAENMASATTLALEDRVWRLSADRRPCAPCLRLPLSSLAEQSVSPTLSLQPRRLVIAPAADDCKRMLGGDPDGINRSAQERVEHVRCVQAWKVPRAWDDVTDTARR